MKLEEMLDEISVRFILNLHEIEKKYIERLYFILEEAYWFYLDFFVKRYKTIYFKFKEFCKTVLLYNNIEFGENDYLYFKTYKKSIPVYGAIILSKDLQKILLVKGHKSQTFFFPKGKKSKDESGIECAEREVKEEVGLDLNNKLSSLSINTSRGIFYFCFGIDCDQKTKTETRNEIDQIHWVNLSDISFDKDEFKVVYLYLTEIKDKIQFYNEIRFKFNLEKIKKKMDEIYICE
ncbi:hypothetical protein H311_02152 [Anncaliia algerae PRA109]|nr:hypothetical protein H311_02152 [Anncaliia algerae PRA109]